MEARTRRLRLGDILVEQGIISSEQLSAALNAQRETGARLGTVLVENGYTTESEIARALHLQLGIEQVDLRGLRIPENILTLVPSDVLRRYCVFPIGFSPTDSMVLLVATFDPLDNSALDNISIITNFRPEPRIALESDIRATIDRHFGADEASQAAEQYMKERGEQLAAAASSEEDSEVTDAPMVALVRSIIEQAIRQRASDIHFDANEKNVRVRYRIDGALTDKMMYDISLLPAIVTRVKILSGMDISEKRRPQDGHMSIIVDRKEYDIRVSALPTYFGEKLVLRLALTGGLTRAMSELGLKQEELAVFTQILRNPNGIILVTGPTGSGKSTTLYTALGMLNSHDANIITVEDPVEATVPGVNQVQVNNKANLTFANALRSILRQDPDIIMIGEIRDIETASLAVQASITGHLVLSTLHTNSAAASITRLLDMGVENYLLSDAIVGIVAQRLVRRLCSACKENFIAAPEDKAALGIMTDKPVTLHRAKGCPLCEETGYYGRIGVYEILTVTPEIKRLIAAQATTEQMRDMAVSQGMKTLHRSAAEYVLTGVTTITEMLKVSFEN